MISFTEEEINRFQETYKTEYGIEIDRDNAIERFTRLVNLIESLYVNKPHINSKVSKNILHFSIKEKNTNKSNENNTKYNKDVL